MHDGIGMITILRYTHIVY